MRYAGSGGYPGRAGLARAGAAQAAIGRPGGPATVALRRACRAQLRKVYLGAAPSTRQPGKTRTATRHDHPHPVRHQTPHTLPNQAQQQVA